MPKKAAGGEAGKLRKAKIERLRLERPPPQLSDKLVAQLQGAVDAAQRRRRMQATQAPAAPAAAPSAAPVHADREGPAEGG